MATIKHFSKRAGDNPPFAIDWGLVLANEGDGDTIATSVWSVSPTGLTIDTSSVDLVDTRAIVQVSGGTVGETYKLVNEITLTTGGYTLSDYITIRVVD